ncbi:hypothetical protein DAEQUDRAFT_596240 [Daedalea quercina L-15889]|uniref:Uncharacterized protein n=1 Tax=Daedalea quercina L-15889 TaxID=1314783 RepID=A0A165SZ36_9APHY|nr:hypothetical protein DAEQUDRAFT_596240 [Daedalea quercina L-15889]
MCTAHDARARLTLDCFLESTPKRATDSVVASPPAASPCPPSLHTSPSTIPACYSDMQISNVASVMFDALSGGGKGGYEIPEMPSLPQITRATAAGIIVAISGNMVISLALNCQKLAHKRLEEARAAEGDELQSQATSGEFERSSVVVHFSRRSHDRTTHACTCTGTLIGHRD